MTQAYKLFVKYDQHGSFVDRSWVFLDDPNDVLAHLAMYDEAWAKSPIPEEVIMIDVDIIRRMGDGGVSLFGRDMDVFNERKAKRVGTVKVQWPFLSMWEFAPTIAIVNKVA